MNQFSRRTVLFGTLAIAATGTAYFSAFAAEDPIVIGYQTTVEPSKVPQADGLYETALGRPIEWRKFDSGADVIAAIASGDVQIGYVGSSPLAAAASRELPITTIFVAGLIGDAEALVVRNGSGIEKPEDLAGHKVAVPFVSTTHYSLLAALEHWKIDASTVEILNLRPPEIAAAWSRGDIDAAYVWDPALGQIKQSGTVLTTSADVAGWGAPTFDAWIARTDLIAASPAAVKAFVAVTGAAYQAYRADPAAWAADAGNVAKIVGLTGARPEDVAGLLAGYTLPTLEEQASSTLLGGGLVDAIAQTAAFQKAQGNIPDVLADYAPYVNVQFVAEAIASN